MLVNRDINIKGENYHKFNCYSQGINIHPREVYINQERKLSSTKPTNAKKQRPEEEIKSSTLEQNFERS